MQQKSIVIVSGLPRSGTSMMMKMLEAGGMEILTDNIRTADDDNPKGYYEFERVKQLKEDKAWMSAAYGKVVKIISALLPDLPDAYHYKIIFMRRHMKEILASQKQMLIRRGEPTDTISDEKMSEIFEDHLNKVDALMKKKVNLDFIYVHYNEVIEKPLEHIRQINRFLDGRLDEEKMLEAVDKSLHRQRK